MRYYTDLEDFKNGVLRLSELYKKEKMMPIILEVNGIKAPFGLCTEQTVNKVRCLVFSGCSSSIDNVSLKNREIQIKEETKCEN